MDTSTGCPWRTQADASAANALAQQARNAFAEEGLDERLALEEQRSEQGGAKLFRIGNSLRTLSGHLSTLAIASAVSDGSVDARTRRIVEKVLLERLLRQPQLCYPGRNHRPVWRADLWTADIGMNIALAVRGMAFDESLATALRMMIRTKCIEPILHDWIDERTRIHALDSMGHNWWPVLVGGAGVMATLLGDDALTSRICSAIAEWCRFAGNDFSRKQRTFGERGDFVEPFSYAEYALHNLMVFQHLSGTIDVLRDWLTPAQLRGFASWLKHSHVRTADGHRPLRFGNVSREYRPHAEVWHTIARLTDDGELLALAHEIKPTPSSGTELLLWRRKPAGATFAPTLGTSVYATAGNAFVRERRQLLAVRAGEFWNHNHLDAGSFIYHADEVIWVDDCGTCTYSRPELLSHYLTPGAHNVAFAPSLAPDVTRTQYEGVMARARFIHEAAQGDVTALCVDTGLLSSQSLLRSYRWLFVLRDEGVVIWDDLAATTPMNFRSVLHSECGFDSESDGAIVLRQGDRRCRVQTFSDAAATYAVQPAPMGQRPLPPDRRFEDCTGHAFICDTEPATRAKFLSTVGVGFRSARWASDSAIGWTCELAMAERQWHLWFNPLADGRVMHDNCICRYGDIETDAYALLLCESSGRSVLYAVNASIVRTGDRVLHGSLARRPLVSIDL
ncbi:MAG: heparinase II/III family protein [Tepidisphaeraceae bacterium]